ncbi:MAG TPA: PQQ-binding-like beta-propeller repeat protein [Bacteroidales bacterium]|nr:PQQ-binding-like beta-propeller repeat protein [Bacteroidales bacterium]
MFIGSHDKHAYCFDARKGTLRWSVNTGMKIEAAPIIAKNEVLFLNAHEELCFLNLENGHVIWKFNLGIITMNSPAVINSGLTIGGGDGNIYYLLKK